MARAIAIGGTATAVTSLGWNVFTWRRQGPVIRLRATCTGRGDAMKISGRIFNQGRFDAQVESGSFQWWTSTPGGGSSTLSHEVPASHIEGMALPLPLAAQTGHEFTLTDVRGIDLGLAVALHDGRPVTLTFLTASGKKAKKRIKYGKMIKP